jgi:hypothetical protein
MKAAYRAEASRAEFEALKPDISRREKVVYRHGPTGHDRFGFRYIRGR